MRLVSPGSLSGAEKLVFDNLRPWLPSNGVCVNVMLGQDPWDIRPLVLINNKVSLYRFSRPLGQKALQALAAEMQGFAVIPGWEMRIEARNEAERVLLIRPMYPQTLEEILSSPEVLSGQRRQELVSGLIDVVRMLKRRSLVHGHLSLANIVEFNGAIVLLDPRLGALHGTKDRYLAPEVVGGDEPGAEVDLFGLGSVLSALLGDHATHQQREIIDRLLLPSPRQRPSIEEVEREFVRSLPSQVRTTVRSGKFVKKVGEQNSQPIEAPSVPATVASPPRKSSTFLLTGMALLVTTAVVLKFQFPSVFNDLAQSIDLLAPPNDPELQLAWKSGDKGRMAVVAEAAILDHSRAAENAIIDDTMSGENRPGVASNLLRVAMSQLWIDQLSNVDRRAALALSVMSLYPAGVKDLPPLSTLHPGIILAVAGQSQARNPSKQLTELGIERLTSLPTPVGPLFAQLQMSGSKNLGDPEVIALAGIISGKPPAETLEAYIGSDSTLPVALARLSIALPLLSANEAVADQLLVILRDRGGEIGQTLSWFDIDGLGVWSKVKGSEKLRIILGELNDQNLKLEQYADLLSFPLSEVRGKSAQALKAKYLKGEGAPLFLVLAGEQNRLSREQTIAFVSALALDVSKRGPYVSALFQLHPAPEMVLLILMARSDKDSSDYFNLEAARYLRKNNSFTTTTEMLQILAHHPEPLARSLAYARLSARAPAQRKILQQRVSEEGDPALLKSITSKLSVANESPMSQPGGGQATPAAPVQPTR